MARYTRRLQGAGPRRGRHGRPGLHADRAAPRRAPTRLRGPVPVPRGAHAVVRRQPGREALPLLRVQGRRATRSRSCMETEGLDFSRRAGVPRRPLRGRARARGGGPARRRRGASAASGCTRCSSARRRTTCAYCGSRRRRGSARVPGRARARGARCCASSASATRRARGTGCWWRRGGRGSPTRSCYAAGLAQRSKQGRLYDRFRGADHVPAGRRARARARVRRARDGRGPAGRST